MVTVYITAPRGDAAELAETLVDERLAACVNRVDCSSTYRWEGEIVNDEEEIMLAKTTDERYPALRDHVESEHPYDVPCIERFDEVDVLPSFADWRAEATSPGGAPE